MNIYNRLHTEYANQYKLLTGEELMLPISTSNEVTNSDKDDDILTELKQLVDINKSKQKNPDIPWITALFIVYHELLRKAYSKLSKEVDNNDGIATKINSILNFYDELFTNITSDKKISFFKRDKKTIHSSLEFLLIGRSPLTKMDALDSNTTICKYVNSNNVNSAVQYNTVFNSREVLLNKYSREMRQIEKQNRNIFNSKSVFTSPSLHKLDIPKDDICKNDQCNDTITPSKYSNIIVQYKKDRYHELLHKREQLLQTADNEDMVTPVDNICNSTPDINTFIKNSKQSKDTINYSIQLQTNNNITESVLGDNSLIAFKLFGLPLNQYSVDRIIKSTIQLNSIITHIQFYNNSKKRLETVMNRELSYPEVCKVLFTPKQ